MAVASLHTLRHRSFALAMASSFLSSIGAWMQSVALGVYLTTTTHNATWLGLLTFAAWMPAVIGSPLGGIVADRWSRERWIQINNLLMTGTSGTLAVLELTHHLSPAVACYLAIAEGFCSSSSWAAWQSLLPDLVEPDEVLAAVSLSSAQFNLGRVIGPAIAGVLLAVGSMGMCFIANAASFVVVLVTFSFVHSPERPRRTERVRPVRELVEGARRAWAVPGCRYPILAVGAVALIASPFISLVPAMAIDVLHGGGSATATLVAAQGIGAVVAALMLPSVAARTSRVGVLRGSAAAIAVAELVYALSPSLIVAAVAIFALGGAYVGTLTGLNSSVQIHAPRAERSRILALYTLSLSVFYPLGSLVQASLAHVVGVREISVIAAIGLGLVVLVVTGVHRTFWHAIGASPETGVSALAD